MSKTVQPNKRSYDEKAEGALHTARMCVKRKRDEGHTDPTTALKNFLYYAWRAGRSIESFGTTDAELREIARTYEVNTGDRILRRLSGKSSYSPRQRHNLIEDARRIFANAGLSQAEIDQRLRPYLR